MLWAAQLDVANILIARSDAICPGMEYIYHIQVQSIRNKNLNSEGHSQRQLRLCGAERVLLEPAPIELFKNKTQFRLFSTALECRDGG